MRWAKSAIASSLSDTRYKQPGTPKIALMSLRNASARSLSRILSTSSIPITTRPSPPLADRSEEATRVL